MDTRTAFTVHPVTLDHLQKIAAVSPKRRLHPNSVPFAVDNDLLARKLIVHEGEGERMRVLLTDLGRKLLKDVEAGTVVTPKFLHDCDNCTFLGHVEEHDLYFCGSRHPTVIARFGSEGPDYQSGLGAAGAVPILGIARERAIKLGLYKEPTPQ